ncbi:MAG: RNA polymerase sigma-70 factor [Planctomycetaceae bacterium]
METFETHRSVLFSLAYRMLGSVADAEDAVQETYVRWREQAGQKIQNLRSYLCTTLTRLCIDSLRSARMQRENYIGPWLPEPLHEEVMHSELSTPELAESLSMAFLIMLESLSPVERAVFLLREIFQFEFDEIACIVQKSAENCRQIASRARKRLSQRSSRFSANSDQARQLSQVFLQACYDGDLEKLTALLARDVTLYSDGGGKVPSALRPLQGASDVGRFLLGILQKAPVGISLHADSVNGQPGFRAMLNGQLLSVLSLDIADGEILSVFIVNNPDKLRHLNAGIISEKKREGVSHEDDGSD